MSTFMKRLGLLLIVLVGLSLAWVAWDNWGRFALKSTRLADTDSDTYFDESPDHQPIAHGAYLARIGGCVACHTQRGQAVMSGGRAVETPFGRVYSSNLTPSVLHGIGSWNAEDFWLALHWGRSRDGHLLVPAFPYNHTSVIARQDSDALLAWLQTLPASEQATPPHEIVWPLATQPALAVWRSLFFKPQRYIADQTQSQNWNRGGYLVQGLGHCAACHGQRNALGGFSAIDDLSGGWLFPQRWVAPSLIDSAQTTLSTTTTDEVALLLRKGVHQQASVSGPMGEYVGEVSQYWSDNDAHAVALYLKSRVADQGNPSPEASLSQMPVAEGAQALYSQHCAGCHGDQGEGKAGKYPALAHNPAVQLVRADNLIQMTLFGGFAPSTMQNPRPYGMPPFIFALQNNQIADVLTFIRSQWGNHAPPVSASEVDKVRSAAY